MKAMDMNEQRRKVLKTGGGITIMALALAAGWLKPGQALAADWNKAAFDTKSLNDTLKALGGSASTETKDVAWGSTPDIAENGAVVPISITANMSKVESIAILIEKNPNMLTASFDIPAGTEPSISTRVKMAQTSNVIALIKADGKFYTAAKEIKVTLGGCGG